MTDIVNSYIPSIILECFIFFWKILVKNGGNILSNVAFCTNENENITVKR